MSRGGGRGRGRGRGRGAGASFAGSLEAIGISPGESVPPPILQPPPLLPTLNRCPLPLDINPDPDDYLITIKQTFRSAMHRSPFCIKIGNSEVCLNQKHSRNLIKKKGGGEEIKSDLNFSWRYFPAELKPKMKLKRIKKKSRSRKRTRDAVSDEEGAITDEGGLSSDGEGVRSAKRSRRVTFEGDEDNKGVNEDVQQKISKRLDRLESLEQQSGDSEQSGEEATEEIYEEEEEEEGTDYNLTYFDNGEDYEGGEDDTLEDGPVY